MAEDEAKTRKEEETGDSEKQARESGLGECGEGLGTRFLPGSPFARGAGCRARQESDSTKIHFERFKDWSRKKQKF